MSFMYNPFPYDDPKPVNRPALAEGTIQDITGGGTPAVAKRFAAAMAERLIALQAGLVRDGRGVRAAETLTPSGECCLKSTGTPAFRDVRMLPEVYWHTGFQGRSNAA